MPRPSDEAWKSASAAAMMVDGDGDGERPAENAEVREDITEEGLKGMFEPSEMQARLTVLIKSSTMISKVSKYAKASKLH